MTRSILRKWMRLVMVAAMIAPLAGSPGCSRSGGEAEAQPASSSEPVTWEFDSPQAVVDHISSLRTGDDYVELMGHLYARTKEEQWAATYAHSIAEARLEFKELLNIAFGTKDEPVVETDLGMKHLAEAIRGREILPYGETRAVVEYEGLDGEPAKLVLAKIRDKWMVHVTSLSNGEEIDPIWCSSRQRRFAAQLKYHRDASMALRKGAYASAEEAQNALEQRLAGPPPDPHTVTP